MNNQNINSD